MKQGTAIFLQDFTDDLRHRLRGVWREVEGVDPREANNKVATYQALIALPFDHNVHKPIQLPGYLHLDLSQHVMQNGRRKDFGLFQTSPGDFSLACTLNVETVSWEDGISPMCNRCSCGQVQDEAHAFFKFMCRYDGLCALRQKYSELFQALPGDFSLHNLFLREQRTVQAVSDFLLQHNRKLFLFMSELLDLLLVGVDQPQADQPNSLVEGPPGI
eukprot:1142726-Pelagomonas_calceolata.AAC.1